MNYINELYKPVARINLTQAGVKFLDTIGEGRKGIEGVEYRRRGGGGREKVWDWPRLGGLILKLK